MLPDGIELTAFMEFKRHAIFLDPRVDIVSFDRNFR
jgi:hypothetical protein